MGIAAKRGKKKAMGDYTPNDDEVKAYIWCINNHIKIAPFAKENGKEWYIEIQQHSKKIHRSKETWGPGEVWKQIYTYYEIHEGAL